MLWTSKAGLANGRGSLAEELSQEALGWWPQCVLRMASSGLPSLPVLGTSPHGKEDALQQQGRSCHPLTQWNKAHRPSHVLRVVLQARDELSDGFASIADLIDSCEEWELVYQALVFEDVVQLCGRLGAL